MSETPTYVWVVTESIDGAPDEFLAVFATREGAMKARSNIEWSLVARESHLWIGKGPDVTLWLDRQEVWP